MSTEKLCRLGKKVNPSSPTSYQERKYIYNFPETSNLAEQVALPRI
jgi:hypothetical protein